MTRIVVLVKDIPDINEIKIDLSTRRPMVEASKRRLNDLDKRALEAAIRLKEVGGMEVVTNRATEYSSRCPLLHAQ